MQRKWWHEKIAYQVYPKSFYDTDGDGIGDLKGVIEKLDYLKELGVDIVWISPVYPSPFVDEGYDISDYYGIDPIFGTMNDMDHLLEEARKRGIGIVMDLVVNHTSDEHEWFKKACEDPDGRYGKFYYIRDWKKGEPLPCNWRSYFGGPCWDLLPGHDDKIYLHVFHKKQPDLNWENPDMRKEIYKMINWWLDKGLAGFRVDAIINIKKKLPFENYPADREDGLCSIDRMLEKATGIGEFLGEMAKETFRPHDAFSVGEVFNSPDEDLPLFIGDDGYFSSMFDFAETLLNRSIKGWYDEKPVTPEQYKKACFNSQAKAEGVGYMSNLIENHDEPRGVSHYIPRGECTPAAKKMLGGLNFMLKGLPFIYQGQEIGMENFKYKSPDEPDDISALNEYQVALDAGLSADEALSVISHFSRDNGRSPFQWEDAESAGFTTGTPWIKVNPNYHEINLALEKDDPDSVWNFYRALINLRKNPMYKETIVYGKTIPYHEEQRNLMAYFRKNPGEGSQSEGPRSEAPESKSKSPKVEKVENKGVDILVLGNFQKDPQDVTLPKGEKKVILNNLHSLSLRDDIFKLEGYQFVILEYK